MGNSTKKILVTGGAGFIGSHLVRYLLSQKDHHVFNIDKLTYAGHLDNLSDVFNLPCHTFQKTDLCDRQSLQKVFQDFQPDFVMHLAAESHVDRSIDGADAFVQTNVVGTYCLLETALNYWQNLAAEKKEAFRFLHVSTDEVFGSLGIDRKFNESSPYQPNSPYAATKASSDLLVRSYYKTFGLPALIVNSSNTYGPHQYPEKLIPLCILNALEGKPLPIYGDGQQIRDWLYVEDHVKALWLVINKGNVGESYCIGGNSEIPNLQVIHNICTILDTIRPYSSESTYKSLVTHVKDRPGHDRRYATDTKKIKEHIGWEPKTPFLDGLKKTVTWYLENQKWLSALDARKRQGMR